MTNSTNELTVSIIIPTLNAAKDWKNLQSGIDRQAARLEQVIVIDSESNDGTPQMAKNAGYTVIPISRREFNHGATRQMAAEQCTSDLLVCLTQDVCLEDPTAVTALIEPYSDPCIAATYGRQLARHGAGAIEEHARMFNYPEQGAIRSWSDRKVLGIRTTFMSNSFASYRKAALDQVGGFPNNVIMAEDAIVTARLLMAGWKSAYVADACAVHSHPYGVRELFRRYFDTGVCHRRESWMVESFGRAGGEGRRFVISELKYLSTKNPFLLFYALVLTGAKMLGYNLGLLEDRIPLPLRRVCSMHKGFWEHNL
jgi:rhamnosyltransferase